jgi:hypothetical protein
MPDIFIKCIECGQEFRYTERDQEFYQERGFVPPKRCKVCRDKKKSRFEEKNNNSQNNYYQ